MEDVIKQVESISLAGMTQPQVIQHITKQGCKYLGLKYPIEDAYPKNRKFIAYILYKYTIATKPEIAELLSYSDDTSVFKAIARVKDEISSECYGNEKTKMIYKGLLNYLKL